MKASVWRRGLASSRSGYSTPAGSCEHGGGISWLNEWLLASQGQFSTNPVS
jgi:hypothetical protein